MAIAYVTASTISIPGSATWGFGSENYLSDANWSEDYIATLASGTVVLEFNSASNFGIGASGVNITGIRLLWGRADIVGGGGGYPAYWNEGYLEQIPDPPYEQWTGNQIQISLRQINNTDRGRIYDSAQGATLTSVSLGASGGTCSDVRAITLDVSTYLNSGPKIIISTQDLASFADFCLEITYSSSHGYNQDQTPPTTTVARAILSPNLFNSTTGVMGVPNTTTPAEFIVRTQLIKPDSYDPETWFYVDKGFWYLGSIF